MDFREICKRYKGKTCFVCLIERIGEDYLIIDYEEFIDEHLANLAIHDIKISLNETEEHDWLPGINLDVVLLNDQPILKGDNAYLHVSDQC